MILRQSRSDIVLTHSDIARMRSDIALTHSDIALTHSDIVLTHSDIARMRSDIVLTHSDIALIRSDIRIKDASSGKFSLRRIFSFSAAARYPFCRKAKYHFAKQNITAKQYNCEAI